MRAQPAYPLCTLYIPMDYRQDRFREAGSVLMPRLCFAFLHLQEAFLLQLYILCSRVDSCSKSCCPFPLITLR